jgi:hypothetical protein
MPHVPKRPPTLAHLSDEAASIALMRHFGDVVKAARELGVDRKDLRKLTWHNPRILNAAHERIELFRIGVKSKILEAVYSRSAKRRRWGFDAMFDSFEFRDHPFASARWIAPAERVRKVEEGRVAVQREAAAELERERAIERQAELRREQEGAERVDIELPVAVRPAPLAQVGWPAGIRRPTRGQRR